MTTKSVTGLFFSPTGTTKKIIESIVSSFDEYDFNLIDITNPLCRNEINIKIESDLLIIGFPVYEEHIPEQLRFYLDNIIISSKYVVAIAVYGNIGYGLSLLEIFHILKEKNLQLISFGAFIGEHSFSKRDVPLALGRPHKNDLQDSINMANLIKNRLNTEYKINENSIPGKLPLMAKILPKNSAKLFTKTPTVTEKCIKCGICIKKCPMGAIQADYSIDETKCIRCFGCVKSCKFQGRDINYKIFLVKYMLQNSNKYMKQNIYL